MDASPDFNAKILLSANGIDKSLASRHILQGIDLTIEEGQIVTLIGPNGAGKTTLVRVLLGLLKPDAGSVYLRPDLRIGYMPQRLFVESTLPITVQRFLRLAEPNSTKSINDALAQLDISELAQQQLNGISGGELQRVLLARALLRNPHLLILDEPAQGVDIAGQAELYELISKIRHDKHCSVLMISHDLHLVMSSTDEVVCLNHHVCCHGKPDQVSADPAFVELFGAKVSTNLAVYTHHHNHEHDIAGDVKATDQ
ncbi:MAG: zinc ABC transporter ATP-binding protein ZnuC [Gammaproteobacteria bacterium]|nr:zinc ABC transporter ATP-binding protein ZnuC [Gammaproteobacteria bacterium]MDD9897159.1 zinc ABC transporter ATP-binding protein ZnuC [Gammaproteobacteria bacterium]MDD9958088.1 zinc ABC transporter ATP-binding protein ZnuC [Gammaproteobacteria bacterium]